MSDNLNERVNNLELQNISNSLSLQKLTEITREIKDTLKELAEEKRQNAILQNEVKHIAESVARIEKRLDKHEENTPQDISTKMSAMDDRIKSLEDNRKWLISTIIGSIILGLLGLLSKIPH